MPARYRNIIVAKWLWFLTIRKICTVNDVQVVIILLHTLLLKNQDAFMGRRCCGNGSWLVRGDSQEEGARMTFLHVERILKLRHYVGVAIPR